MVGVRDVGVERVGFVCGLGECLVYGCLMRVNERMRIWTRRCFLQLVEVVGDVCRLVETTVLGWYFRLPADLVMRKGHVATMLDVDG